MTTQPDALAALDLPQLEEAISQAQAQLDEIEKTLTPLERKRDRQYAKLQRLWELRDRKKIDQMRSTPDWKWLLSYSPYPPDSTAKH